MLLCMSCCMPMITVEQGAWIGQTVTIMHAARYMLVGSDNSGRA